MDLKSLSLITEAHVNTITHSLHKYGMMVYPRLSDLGEVSTESSKSAEMMIISIET